MKWTKIVKSEVNNKVKTKEEQEKFSKRAARIIYKIISNIEYDLKKYKKNQNWICQFSYPNYGLIYPKNKQSFNITISFDNTFSNDELRINVMDGYMGTEDFKFLNEELIKDKFSNIFEITDNDIDYITDMIIDYILKKDKEIQPKQKEEQQSTSKTVYSVELLNNEGDTETSTDCNSYDEAIQAMEKYKNNKTQYVDSWGLSGKGKIIKYTQDENGNIDGEKVLKTFWL